MTTVNATKQQLVYFWLQRTAEISRQDTKTVLMQNRNNSQSDSSFNSNIHQHDSNDYTLTEMVLYSSVVTVALP